MYRVLRDDEDIKLGLYAKNPSSDKSINDYIEHGSDEGFKSKYIACCKTQKGLRNFLKAKDKRVAKITIDDESTCIDLTDFMTGGTHLSSDKAYNFVAKFEIVLLTVHIKPDRLEYL